MSTRVGDAAVVYICRVREVVKWECSCLTNWVNPTRLFVLGALARHGPMYGHQIRRDARVDRTELWSEVRPGSLYGALHRMAAEGLIEAVRTEQVGKAPARTVYAITGEGRKELRALRAEAFRQVSLRPDPVDLAVAMSSDLPAGELRGLVEDRHRALTTQREFFRHEQDRAWAEQTTADSLILQHAIGRLDAEIRWHEDLLLAIPMLSAVLARGDDPPEPPDRRSTPSGGKPPRPRGEDPPEPPDRRSTPSGGKPPRPRGEDPPEPPDRRFAPRAAQPGGATAPTTTR
jgi:DNA-binding PadR family transcriptional regulator